MKKKLEADLISIAHRILKMKNKSDVILMHLEAQKLYEKLSVLRFVEENFSGSQPTIGRSQIEEKLDNLYEPVQVTDDQPVIENISIEALADVAPAEVHEEAAPDENAQSPTQESDQLSKEEPAQADDALEQANRQPEVPLEEDDEDEAVEPVKIIEPEAEPEKKEVFTPSFELSFDPKQEEPPKPATPQFSFDDLLGKDYADPVFVKREGLHEQDQSAKAEVQNTFQNAAPATKLVPEKEHKNISLNDRLSKGIIIGLNDRIAFMNHLFNNSSEEYNRVLSQLMTFDTFAEARTFIEQMVKPDYNNWVGKEEYEERFMEIVEKRFL